MSKTTYVLGTLSLAFAVTVQLLGKPQRTFSLTIEQARAISGGPVFEDFGCDTPWQCLDTWGSVDCRTVPVPPGGMAGAFDCTQCEDSYNCVTLTPNDSCKPLPAYTCQEWSEGDLIYCIKCRYCVCEVFQANAICIHGGELGRYDMVNENCVYHLTYPPEDP